MRANVTDDHTLIERALHLDIGETINHETVFKLDWCRTYKPHKGVTNTISTISVSMSSLRLQRNS